eukprot:scaffold55797_cov31-Tisochrysis_lutea.AAC.2
MPQSASWLPNRSISLRTTASELFTEKRCHSATPAQPEWSLPFWPPGPPCRSRSTDICRSAAQSSTRPMAAKPGVGPGAMRAHALPLPASGNSGGSSTSHQPSGSRTALMPCRAIQSKCAAENQ